MKDIHLMYLASLYISFDLDPSVPSPDKDRLLLSLREKLKQKFKNKLTLRIDDHENSIGVAFFEHNYEKLKGNLHTIVEYLEASSEARIGFYHKQVFSWFDGQFIDTTNKKLFDHSELKNKNSKAGGISAITEITEKTIVYSNFDEDEISPSRFTRRNLRIPTRK